MQYDNNDDVVVAGIEQQTFKVSRVYKETVIVEHSGSTSFGIITTKINTKKKNSNGSSLITYDVFFLILF